MPADGFWLSVLADAAVKSTLMLGAAWAVCATLRKAPAAARHLVWTAAAVSLLALPALTYLTPAWDVPVSTAIVPAGGPAFRTQAVGLADWPRLSPAPAAHASPSHEHSSRPALPAGWAFGIWSAGVLVSLAPMVLGMIALRWRRRGAILVPDDAWDRLIPELKGALGIRGRVRVLLSHRTSMPMSAGLLAPVVVLPEEAAEWPQARRRMVLLHELAHVQRKDLLTQSLARVACSLYWFHPLAWFCWRRAVLERERACDDRVLQAGARPSDYAGELLQVARRMAQPAWGAVAMARRAQLEGRLLAILDERAKRGGVTRSGVLAAALLAVLALLPIAAIRPVQAQVPAGKIAGEADAAAKQGRTEDAIAAYRKAADEQKALHGADSIEYAAAALRAARYIRAHGNVKESEPLFAAALPVYERVYGPARADLADVYEYMGNLALSKDTAKAREFYDRALRLATGAAAGRLTALLGQVEALGGDASAAERLFLRAISLTPEQSPDRALALEFYSLLLRSRQRTAEAAKAEGDALAIRSNIVAGSFGRPKAGEPALRIRDGVTAPVVAVKVEPQYSEQGLANKYEATAIYNIVISAAGVIESASLKHSAGLGLDEQGAAALRRWKFQPGTRDGRPVPVHATVEVNFRLM